MTVMSCPAATPAEVIFRIVVATPLTSSSVSVNHARFRFFRRSGVVPQSVRVLSRSHSRRGNRKAWM